MKINEENKFVVINDEGKEIECEVLFTFENQESKKNYIVYTDHTSDDNGNIKTFASIYDPSGQDTSLTAIETDEEWSMVENILEKLQEEN